MLAALLNTPRDENQWSVWSYHHRLSHDAIRQAIQAQRGVTLTDYGLDPIAPDDVGGWLQRNSQTHGEMNGALRVQSQDLLDIDFQDPAQLTAWIWLHYLEHQTAEQTLEI